MGLGAVLMAMRLRGAMCRLTHCRRIHAARAAVTRPRPGRFYTRRFTGCHPDEVSPRKDLGITGDVLVPDPSVAQAPSG